MNLRQFIEKKVEVIRNGFADVYSGKKDPMQNDADVAQVLTECSIATADVVRGEIEKICDEKTMPRIWNLDKDSIDKFIKTFPDYEPKESEEYQVGFVRGETWGAQKIKQELLKALREKII